MRGLDEGEHPLGQRPLVEEVADQDDVEAAGLGARAEQVLGRRLDRHGVGCRVEADGRERKCVDVGREHVRGAGPHGGDPRQARCRRRGRARAGPRPGRGCREDSAPAPARRPRRTPSRAAARSSAPSSSSVFCQIGSDSSARCKRISGTSGTGSSLVLARMKSAGSMPPEHQSRAPDTSSEAGQSAAAC